MPDEAPNPTDSHPHGALRLQPDRRMVQRNDRLRQKWWAIRARLRLRLGRRRV